MPNARVSVVADVDPQRLASLQQTHPGIGATTRVEEVLCCDVDGVVIATPISTHYGLAKEALLRGKHVLVEKPLTACVAEAEELVELAERQQRVLMVGHTFQYSPAVNELRRLVQSGDLGRIYCVEMERLNLGLFRSDVNVIWDLAPHDLSILFSLFGAQPKHVSVQARAHVQAGIHDSAHLDFDFEGGMSAHVHVSWLYPCKVRRVTVIGDRRMAVYDDTNPTEMLRIYNKGADVHVDPVVCYRLGETIIPQLDWIEPLRVECEDFVDSIRLRRRPRANGEVGLAVVRVLAAVEEALERQAQALAAPVLAGARGMP